MNAASPPGGKKGPRRGNPFPLLLCLVSLLLTAVISQGIYRSYTGPDYARQRLEERRNYHREVLSRADISFRKALFYEVLE